MHPLYEHNDMIWSVPLLFIRMSLVCIYLPKKFLQHLRHPSRQRYSASTTMCMELLAPHSVSRSFWDKTCFGLIPFCSILVSSTLRMRLGALISRTFFRLIRMKLVYISHSLGNDRRRLGHPTSTTNWNTDSRATPGDTQVPMAL